MSRRRGALSIDEALAIHSFEIERHGGLDGVRDETLLAAAVARPWQTFGGAELYPTIEEKAARLGFEVVTQHPFCDGNKRTGAALVIAFLRGNGIRFKPRADDFYDMIMGVADGSLGYEDLLGFVRESCSS
ncbi:MAG: type II toxin-antitoxin system death-on-curing family toxin [Atopobiaceae bacterium]|jgi:death-on-curing protein|nr:type II toxin-antitoxin system death-on-curing family toxin [Atopobiaceae bacterium]MCH4180135.1 type II toxin-antitoxin system death-on-curing family toxin [Atopobiaceae bacterium]MCH4213813.1 type II toxin-antitoxin system death-on-curing family toxin [Atopobiaceae bacterium]MCH4229808.1 type II toxin-antitoxin system death-on-curing family toxin [Atopobiaceae bacterium]MCH4275724.1 type II toxin-antitoxin system death-on-curing family toxin [Atopobiaceae bacterium]